MHTEEAILIDVFLNNGIMAWFKSGRNLFLKTAFKPTIFIGNTDLEKLRSKLMLYGIRSELTARRTITQQRMPVLAVTADPANVRHLVFELEREYPDARLYNADLHEEQYYLFAEHLFPFCKVKIAHDGEDLKRIELLGESIPELTKTTIQIETSYSYLKDFGCSITRLCMNDQVLEGDERYLMECLQHHLEDEDPDILMVEDSNITLPLLYHRAKLHNIQLKLSRFPQDLSYNQGKSYFSYGRVLYRPRSILLKGRLNIDPSSFLYKESGFSGVAELAILGRMSIQRLAMRSPGAGLSSMQSYAAYKDGILIPYKENLVEKFKSASTLFKADRGGLIYEPPPGIHGNTAEIDFVSMYPTIMVTNNISPETVLCDCCRDNIKVPELDYNICRHRGLIPKMLSNVLLRRLDYKRKQDKARATALKWLLVTSFGYMGFRKSKFGRIEAHEAINAFARDKLLTAVKLSERHGFRVLHGIIDSLWVQKRGITKEAVIDLCEDIEKYTGIDIAIEGLYRWVVFLPSIRDIRIPVPSRFYGAYKDGSMKLRGIAIRRHDSPKIVCDMQQDMLSRLARCMNPEEFLEEMPSAMRLLRDYAAKLEDADVDDLVVRRRITKLDYKVNGPQLQVVEQLKKEGIILHPGNSIRYVITTDGYSAAGFFSGRVDKSKYAELLCRACFELFQPFVSMQDVVSVCKSQKVLGDWI